MLRYSKRISMLLLIFFVFLLIPFKEGLGHKKIIPSYKLEGNIKVWLNVWIKKRAGKSVFVQRIGLADSKAE